MNIDVKTVQRAVVGHGIAHDSAAKQIAGEASYIDDMAELPGTLHAALVISPVAHGKLKGIDPVKALAMPGVVAFVAAADIPGHNEVGPILPNEPLFAEDIVEYVGQPVGAIAAETYEQAVKAARAGARCRDRACQGLLRDAAANPHRR